MKRLFPAAMMAALLFTTGLATQANAGKIVVNHDDWTFRNVGFTNANPDTANFAVNIANWFAGGTSGNFLAYSTNAGLTGSTLASTMTGAGHSWTSGFAVPFNLATPMNYDGVFLSGHPGYATASVLIDYVNAGGNVYVGGGSGYLGAMGEAALWKPFLNIFGLAFDGSANYNQVNGVFAVTANFALTRGVDELYYNNGLTVRRTGPSDYTSVFGSANGFRTLALYDSEGVPEAGSLALLVAGLGTLGLAYRRRHNDRGTGRGAAHA